MDTRVGLYFSEILETLKELVRAAKMRCESGVGFYEYDDNDNAVH